MIEHLAWMLQGVAFFLVGRRVVWLPLHDEWMKRRSRRTIDGYKIWIEELDSRGRRYDEGLSGTVMYRVLYPDSKDGWGLPCLVPAALAKYIREHP